MVVWVQMMEVWVHMVNHPGAAAPLGRGAHRANYSISAMRPPCYPLLEETVILGVIDGSLVWRGFNPGGPWERGGEGVGGGHPWQSPDPVSVLPPLSVLMMTTVRPHTPRRLYASVTFLRLASTARIMPHTMRRAGWLLGMPCAHPPA